MRIAVVDVGTNTTRLYIAEVQDARITHELTRISTVTRLGAGVDASGRLADDALAREHAVLSDYAEQIATAKAERAVAVMTSAVRDAANGQEFADDASARYGLDVHILSGDDEAMLTYRGATDELDPASTERILVVDIGGGSTELVLGHGISTDFHVSTQAGVVRQADRHITTDPPSADELQALADDVHATLAAGVPENQRTGVERALGVAGTATSLAGIDLALDPYDPARVHGYTLSRETVDRIERQLSAMTLEQRQHVPGIHPDRALVIVPGTIILSTVMDLFALEQIDVSEHDILRGAALHYATTG
jgi:exopolyphosphatase / guanosine-5'-triphosphate,3'-diphosphate pyrophosphatase